MPGYLVACVTWHDDESPRKYGDLVVDSLKPYGGKYLARGAPAAQLEGEHPPKRLAIVEFPTAEAAQEWHASKEYVPASKIRKENATTHWVIVMDGAD
jgi:uncharacterized protein (DUF1330 family)